MMSETAFFVKDVVGPAGSVSIVSSIDDSSDIQSHSLAEALRYHPTVRPPAAANPDRWGTSRWSGGWVLPAAVGQRGEGTGGLAAPARLTMERVVAQGLGVEDEMIPIDDTPEHEELCERQAARLYDAITTNTDLTSHLHDAVESLRIVSASLRITSIS
eukprot:COSAG04_NODE_6351_length_1350_cov_0.798561_2_plen_159_part_00